MVNKIKVVEPAWNFEPIWVALKDQWNSFLTTIPSIFLGLIVLIFTYIISRYIAAISPKFLQNRVANSLLRKFISWAIGALVFLMGLYIIFNIMGLTAIALTVVGGTGLIGIILGIAFKDITENFLASLFLSVNNPFEMGDLVEIDNIIGYIESLTFRSTVLIKTNGTYVQIPNSTVYKSVIHNYTSNRKQREDFIAGIGYENNITDAQAAALKILKEHPAVLNYPEPLVLVDSLGSSCVNLKVYFWIDNSQNSSLKVKSSVMRLIKNSFANLQISMPDQDREIVFPDGINIQIEEGKSSKLATKIDESNSQTKVESNTLLTSTEGNFTTDENEIKEQAHQTNSPEKGSNLLSN